MGDELTVTVLLKQQLPYQQAQEQIGRLINFAMLRDEQLKEQHETPVYKFYCFNNLYPVEQTGVYQQGKIYLFKIRSAQTDFAEDLRQCLHDLENDRFQILSVALRQITLDTIHMLYALTPVIVTVDDGPFLPDGDLALLVERLEANAIKKYKALIGNMAGDHRFIERLDMISRKPNVTHYKHMNYLGVKVRATIYPDEWAQKLAQTIFFAGLGEKNSSLGAGYCTVQ